MVKVHMISRGSQVRLHFSLTLADGTVAVSTFGESPLTFTLGDGTMVESLEQSLIGMTEGEEAQLILSGDDAFGAATDDNIQRMPISEFPADMTLAPGQLIAFTTPAGEELGGVILQLDESEALVDFNHPLSGQPIAFQVQILEVTQADDIGHIDTD